MPGAVIRVAWTFAAGGAGVSTHVVRADGVGVEDAMIAADTFWWDVFNNYGIGVTGKVQSEAEYIQETTGEITGTFSTAHAFRTIVGQGTGNYAAGVGARVRWKTGGRRNNRRVVGTSYCLPLAQGSYQADGTLNETMRTAILGHAEAFIDACAAAGTPLCVWSRPSEKGASDGSLHDVLSAEVPDKVSWLRSRKS